MSKHVFCRDLCLERDEPLEGTGDAPARVLMLAWPRGKWRTPRWESLDMGETLSRAVHDAALSGLHVALVDRVGESGTLPQLHALPESVKADFASEAELVAAIRAYTQGVVFEGEYDPRITVLVCTDSRRDACCARYGFSAYKALDAIADREKFNIVQATHVGGCRFAASLVVMPHRQRYGRMTAGQAPAFLEALSRGEIFLPAYKGRTDAPEALQIAEIAAMKWTAENGRPATAISLGHAPLPQDPHQGDEIDILAQSGATRLGIRLRAETFHIQGNCQTVADNGGEHALRWRLASITPLR